MSMPSPEQLTSHEYRPHEDISSVMSHARFADCKFFLSETFGENDDTNDISIVGMANLSELTRRQQRASARLVPRLEGIMYAGARALVSYPPNERYDVALKLACRTGNKAAGAMPLYEQVAAIVTDGADKLDGFLTASDETVQLIEAQLINGDRYTEYSLLRQLTEQDLSGKKFCEENEKNYTLHSVLLNTKSQVADYLQEQLEQGEYHHYVAYDLLTDSLAQESPTNGTAKLRDMVRFTEAFVGLTDREHIVGRMAHIHKSWPEDQAALFSSRITQVNRTLRTNINATRELSRGVITGLSDNAEREFTSQLLEFYVASDRARRGGQSYNKAEIMQARAAEKRKARPQTAMSISEAIMDRPEQIREPYEIVRFIPKDGSVDSLDSESFQSMKADFLGRTPDSSLAADLERVIEHCGMKLDFASGYVDGVKKLTNLTINVDGRAIDLFEFKPKFAPGLSLVSKRGKEMRLIISLMEQNQLGIMAICDRDRLNTTLRGLGVSGGGAK